VTGIVIIRSAYIVKLVVVTPSDYKWGDEKLRTEVNGGVGR
jgi:hypothetical protein